MPRPEMGKCSGSGGSSPRRSAGRPDGGSDAAYIRKVVDAAPPLNPGQRSRLALLLGGGPDA